MVRKILWFPIMILSIPIDIILWNMIFGLFYGFISPMKSIEDNFKQWRNL